uniref:Uncharacterized protein n=1 Tax=viral metagenome TaxID=1070528 RepID=A0A6C0JWX9_9ZZZZ
MNYVTCPKCYLNSLNQIETPCENCSQAKIQCRSRNMPYTDTRQSFPLYGSKCVPLPQKNVVSTRHLMDLWYWQQLRQTSTK